MMRSILWRFLEFLSNALTASERIAVLGDLMERGDAGGWAVIDLAGLIVRRQTALWAGWRPWLALACLIPFAMILSLASRLTADASAITLWLYFNNWDWKLWRLPAFQHDFPRFLAVVLGSYFMLSCCSWIAGLVLGAIARAATISFAVILCLFLLVGELMSVPMVLSYWRSLHQARDLEPNAAVFAVSFYRVWLPLLVQILLAAIPALYGMRQTQQMRREINEV